jgi:selenide,water dikinase
MLTLNRAASEAMRGLDVHACTDITGFGFLGHAREVAAGSGVTLEIDAAAVRLLPGALEYALAGALPGGLKNNLEFVSDCVAVERTPSPGIENLLYDPQTSGGLLISIAESDASRLEQRLDGCYAVGRVVPRRAKPIHLL